MSHIASVARCMRRVFRMNGAALRLGFVLLLLVMTAVAGCAGSGGRGDAPPEAVHYEGEVPPLQLGMTKQQVLSMMGQPAAVHAQGRVEYYCYQVARYGRAGEPSSIYVKHKDNLVVGYGEIPPGGRCGCCE